MTQSIAQIDNLKPQAKYSKKELLSLGTELSRETALPEDVDVQLDAKFINSKENRLSWKEFNDDKNVPDQSEWHD